MHGPAGLKLGAGEFVLTFFSRLLFFYSSSFSRSDIDWNTVSKGLKPKTTNQPFRVSSLQRVKIEDTYSQFRDIY